MFNTTYFLIVVEGGDSSGISEKVETPQGAQRLRRLDLARGKRPPATKITALIKILKSLPTRSGFFRKEDHL